MTDPIELAEQATKQQPGWHPYFGGLRFHDGNEWTDHIAPPRVQTSLDFWETVGAVCFGIIGAAVLVGGFLVTVIGT